MEIDENAQLFMTKGDANEKQDTQPVKWENVYGTVVFTVPYVGMYGCFLAPGMEKRRFCPVSWRFLCA